MNTTLKPAVSPLQLRDELETMVLKELLGPGSAEEEIIESPGTRYFVGVLAPRKRAKAGAVPAKAAAVPATLADEDEGRCGRRNPRRRRTGPRGPGHGAGRHDRSGPGAGQGADPVIVWHDLLGEPGGQGDRRVRRLGPVPPGKERIPRQREDGQSQAGLEAVSPWRQAPADAPGRPDPADCGRSQLPRSRRPGPRPQAYRSLVRHPVPRQRAAGTGEAERHRLGVPTGTDGRGRRMVRRSSTSGTRSSN